MHKTLQIGQTYPSPLNLMPVFFFQNSQNSIFTDTVLHNKSHTNKYSVVAHAIFSNKYFTYICINKEKYQIQTFFVQNTFFLFVLFLLVVFYNFLK